MSFKKKIIEDLERRKKILEQEPIRLGKIAEYINKNFPESIKIMGIESPLTVNWLKDNEYAIVLFDINEPHRPVPVIVEFTENDILQIRPYNEKADDRLKKWMKN